MSKKFYDKLMNTMKEKVKNAKENSGNGGKEFIKYIYPYKHLETKSKLQLRILPRGEDKCWWTELNIHRFKVGKLTKICTCMNSLDDDGKPFGKCDFCTLLSNHGKTLSKNTKKELYPKTNFVALVYHYAGKTMYKLNLTDFDISNILEAMENFDDDERDFILSEGFNIFFENNDKGYATITKVTVPKSKLDEVEGLDVESIPDLIDEVKPNGKLLEYMKTTYDTAVNFFCPELAEDNDEEDEDEDDKYSFKSDEEEEEEEVKTKKNKKMVFNKKEVEEEEEETKEEVSDDEDDDEFLGIKKDPVKKEVEEEEEETKEEVSDEDDEDDAESVFDKIKKDMINKKKGK